MHDIGFGLEQGQELLQAIVRIGHQSHICSGDVRAGVNAGFNILDTDNISFAHHQSASGECGTYISLPDYIQFF